MGQPSYSNLASVRFPNTHISRKRSRKWERGIEEWSSSHGDATLDPDAVHTACLGACEQDLGGLAFARREGKDFKRCAS